MELIIVFITYVIFLFLWEQYLSDNLIKNKISNFQIEQDSENKSFLTKVFNYKDKRYIFLLIINVIFYQVGWNIDTNGAIPIRYPISFPIFWYIIFQSAAAYIGFQSKKVVGREKILWIFATSLLPWIVFPIYLFLKRSTVLEENDLENEYYWDNFLIVSFSIIIAGFFIV